MTDTSEPTPTLDWETAPDQFREAHKNATDQLNRLKEDAAERDKLRREVAMLRAGVDSQDPFYEYFTAGYSGKEDPEEIAAAWQKLRGTAQPPPLPGEEPEPTPTNEPSDELIESQRQLQEVRAKLRTNSVAPGEEPSPHPFDAALAVANQAKERGRTREQQTAAYLQTVFNAAVAGDERIVSKSSAEAKEKWRKRQGL